MTDERTPSTDAAELVAASKGTEIVEPGQRGRTVVADKVVESIAAIAAGEVEAVVPTRTGWADVRRGLPRASAVVRRGESRISVEVATTWPLPVSRVAQQVRGHVHERVGALTGMTVAAVDVTVAGMVQPPDKERVQ